MLYSCILAVQSNLKSLEAIEGTIMFFNTYSKLKIVRLSFDELFSAVEIMKENDLDFDDSLIIACMKAYGIKELVSLDKHFDKIKAIKRISL